MDRNRILMLFGLAWVSAALLTWFLYASTTAPKQEKRTAILAATRDLAVGQVIHKSDLKSMSVLPRDLPKGSVAAQKDAVDRVVLTGIAANAPIIANQLSTITGAEGVQATIDPGLRAVSVPITDVSGVAGLVRPGAHVDVLFTRPGGMAEAITTTILQDVKVLAVGQSVQPGQAPDPKAPKMPVVTLVVTPDDAQKLELAKNQGKISFSLRNPLDGSAGVNGLPVTGDVLDPTLKAKVLHDREVRNAPPPPAPDVVRELKLAEARAKEKEKPAAPPPPRAVVDVFRGDKHVQEVFRE